MIAIEQTLLANYEKQYLFIVTVIIMRFADISALNWTLTLNLVSLVDGILYYVMYPRATKLSRSRGAVACWAKRRWKGFATVKNFLIKKATTWLTFSGYLSMASNHQVSSLNVPNRQLLMISILWQSATSWPNQTWLMNHQWKMQIWKDLKLK